MADSSSYSLNLNILGSNNAGAALSSFIGGLAPFNGLISSIGSNLSSAFGNAKFALQNVGTQGTLAKDAMQAAGHDMSSALLGIGVAATIAGAAITVGIGVASVNAAEKYQQSMNSVQAQTGSTTQQMKTYDTQLKQLAVDAGVAPLELSKGLYQVISAGYSGAAALKVLTLATQDSKIGMTDETTVADALTNVLAGFRWETQDTTRVNGIMLETVTLGKSTFQNYASQITKAASAASQYHISLETMSAAWATMTANGLKATQASTDFQQLTISMDAKIGTITKSLHSSGIAFDEAKFNTMSYGQQVMYLNTALQEAAKKHVTVTGVTVQAAQAITKISQNIGMYNKDLATLSDKQKMAQQTAQEWATTQNGFAQQMSRVGAAVQVLLIDIGQQLLPVLTDFAKQLVPIIVGLADWLTKSGTLQTSASVLGDAIRATVFIISGFVTVISNVVLWFVRVQGPGEILRAILIGIGYAILGIKVGTFLATIPALIAGFAQWAAAAWATAVAELAAMGPLLLIGIAIAAAVALIILAVTHWGAILDWITNKTEQTRIKVEIANSQQAVKTDQQQKKSAQDTLKNLEKEKADILAKLKTTHDAATKAELQHQLEMTQRQIDGQNQRIQAADRDAAAQRAKQAQLHADLLEAQKTWNVRFDDMVDTWVGDQVTRFNRWRQSLDSTFNQWASDTLASFGRWRQQFDANFNAWVASSLATINGWRQSIDNTFNSWVAGAVNWGRDLIQNLINGISSMLPNLSAMAQTAANQIASVLHFTHPSKGPLVTVEQWMPHLGDTLVMGLNRIAPQLQAAALRAAASVAGPIKGSADGSMPSHIFDFIGSNYSGYSSGMATTAKREEAAQDKAARHAAVVARQENALDAHIAKLENHYNIVVHAHGKGKWTKADAAELAKLLAEEARLQGKHPQTASGRRN